MTDGIKSSHADTCPVTNERVTVEDMRKFAGIKTEVSLVDQFKNVADRVAEGFHNFMHPPVQQAAAAPPASAPVHTPPAPPPMG